jgi:hypothetical protein
MYARVLRSLLLVLYRMLQYARMVKLIMTWDIQEGKEQAYIEFAVGELSPALNALGLQIREVWYTQAGSGPEMVVAGLMPTRTEAQALLRSGEWQRLREQLNEFVEDITIKVVRPHGPFQM